YLLDKYVQTGMLVPSRESRCRVKPLGKQTAAAPARSKTPATRCPAEATLGIISGRWKVPILWHLLVGTRRFSELRRALGNVTQKMLAQNLRELERDG